MISTELRGLNWAIQQAETGSFTFDNSSYSSFEHLLVDVYSDIFILASQYQSPGEGSDKARDENKPATLIASPELSALFALYFDKLVISGVDQETDKQLGLLRTLVFMYFVMASGFKPENKILDKMIPNIPSKEVVTQVVESQIKSEPEVLSTLKSAYIVLERIKAKRAS